MKFSVILLMYNSGLKQTLMTVKSIVLQNIEEMELIIADDGSECKYKWTEEIVQLCNAYSFYNYRFADSKTNVGTVKNILRALELASGKYVKVIGAGDLLWDENSLQTVYKQMTANNAYCAFCDFKGYAIENNEIVNRYFSGPFDKTPYLKGSQEKIKQNMIMFCDYILGAALFFQTFYLAGCLFELRDVVKYAEDLTQVIVVLRKDHIFYIPQKHIIYEVGSGISTSKGASNRMRLDAENFEKKILSRYNEPIVIEKRKKSHKLEGKNALQSAMIRFLDSPIWYLRNFRRSHFRYAGRSELGFLEQKEFTQEFGLLRR